MHCRDAQNMYENVRRVRNYDGGRGEACVQVGRGPAKGKKNEKIKNKAHLSAGSLKRGKASAKIREQMPRYLPLN
ncbi:hypothetical protein E2C01_045259 [Portunus trituberculatus]|uniref:Uncharacterized protein n=1 Tax=Portunus trituberculatus TaxID=210409 RepID=A0A5B7G1I1_PORTR|nr:hypothetical protein [Portunus trituberculatus]